MTHPIDEVLWEATREGKVAWEFIPRASTLGPPELSESDVVGQPLRAHVGNRWFRLYEYRYKHWYEADRFEWARDVALEVSDDPQGPMAARVPTDTRARALLELARARAAHLDDLDSEIRQALAAPKEAASG